LSRCAHFCLSSSFGSMKSTLIVNLSRSSMVAVENPYAGIFTRAPLLSQGSQNP
jgi:predicted ATPase